MDASDFDAISTAGMPADSSSLPADLGNLYPALVECFGIILLGYVAAKFSFISDLDSRGLSTFVGTFALPALVFSSLCRLDMSNVNWNFLLGILIAKFALFFLVLGGALLAIRDAPRSGLFAIFVTQSNDFALGFPILQAVYGHSHPDYPMYIYLMAPISLVILNPVGLICLEIGSPQSTSPTRFSLAVKVIKNVIKNPIIFMTVAGVIGNFAFGESGLPPIVDRLLTTLGSAFSAAALFLLGIRMVGQSAQKPQGNSAFVIALILILLKTLVLPLLAREAVSLLDEGKSNNSTTNGTELSNLAFLYGTFPTAPSVFVYAAQYDVEAELTATSMVACTFVAAPIMFISARLLSLKRIDPLDYIEQLDRFLLDVSIVGLMLSVWVSLCFVITKKYLRVPHVVTLALSVSQALSCIGGLLWSLVDCTHGWTLYVQFCFFAFGVYSARIQAALLSVALLLVYLRPACQALRVCQWLVGAGFGVAAALVVALLLSVKDEAKPHGEKIDPNFQYGSTQAYVALILLIVCFCISLVMMVLTQRQRHRLAKESNGRLGLSRREEAERHLLEESEDDISISYNSTANGANAAIATERTRRTSPTAIEDLIEIGDSDERRCHQESCHVTSRNVTSRRYRCDSEHREYCSTLLSSYAAPPATEALNHPVGEDSNCDDFQVFGHSVLLLLLIASMFVGKFSVDVSIGDTAV